MLSALLAVCVIFTSVPVNALSTEEINTEQQTLNDFNTENSTSTAEEIGTLEEVATASNLSKDTSISDISSNDIDFSEEKLNNEILLHNDDNWELSLNFYDRQEGIIEEKEMNWDASNGSYEKSAEKEIILQVNYRNDNLQRNYNIGDLVIKIPNLMYGCEDSNIKTSISMTANTKKQSGYKWNYETNEVPDNGEECFTFTNAEEITSNTVGSFQIVYVVNFKGDNEEYNEYGQEKYYPEEYENSCFKSFSSSTYATLNESLQTQNLAINLERTYSHVWETQNFSIEEKASSFVCPNGIVDNKEDYIWVEYRYRIPENDCTNITEPWLYHGTFPYYKNNGWKLKTTFPKDCVVLDSSYNIIANNIESTNFKVSKNGKLSDAYFYVGYPRSAYNEEKNTYLVNNKAELYVDYDSLGYELSSKSDITINLGEFALNYGGLGNIAVSLYEYSDIKQRYEYMTSDKGNFSWYKMPMIAKTTGLETDVFIGMDKIFITGVDNEYKVLGDNEYGISYISFPEIIYDGYGKRIPENTYECELYIRKNGEEEYKLYDTFKNPEDTKEWDVSDGLPKDIVSFYFKIKDIKDGIFTQADSDLNEDTSNTFTFRLNISNAKIAKQGKIWVFDYLKVYDKKGTLLNPGTLDNYEGFSKELLAPLDIENHGTCLYRWIDDVPYDSFDLQKSMASLGIKKEMQIDKQDEENEKFVGTADIHLTKGYMGGHDTYFDTLNYQIDGAEYIRDDQKIKGFEVWDLLPYGMNLESTEEDIRETIIGPSNWSFNLTYNDKPYDSLTEQLKDSFHMEIVENWKNTGRTWMHIKFDFGKDTAIIHPVTYLDVDYLSFKYNFSVSYDSFMENSTYTNNAYTDWITNKFSLEGRVADDGSTDKDAIDINENGKTDDNLAHAISSVTIESMVACQQDITKYVQTDKKNFTTGLAESSLDSEYQYKLRINTGSTAVTNLVIYDNLETAFGNNEYWQGEFIDVDTSYAKSKGYQVEVYYSNKADANILENDNSWKLLTDKIPRQDVKSLAFKYLDADGNSAILPINSMTYVIIKMKSPEKYNSFLTHNDARVEWNSIDNFGNVVDGIVGLHSNVVNVNLPKVKGVNIKLLKNIIGSQEDFDCMQLDSNALYNFQISMKNTETGNVISVPIDNKNTITVKEVPIGTYVITEKDDMYFDFVSMETLNSVEGVTLEKVDNDYILTITDAASNEETLQIKVNNKIEPDRPYEDKDEKANLFNFSPNEEASLFSRIEKFFTK